LKKSDPSFKGNVTYDCYVGAGAQGPKMGLVMASMLDPIGFHVTVKTDP